MNLILFLIIIIILVCIFYLCYRNYQYNKVLENFDSTQSSLSTYYQQTVDYDSYMNPNYGLSNKTALNKFNYIPTNKVEIKKWDGLWTDNSTIYMQFLQVNDKLIISLSDSDYLNKIQETPTAEFSGNTYNSTALNTSIGIGQLDINHNNFLLTRVIDNNCTTISGLYFVINQLTGSINNNKITLTSISAIANGTSKTFTLYRSNKYLYDPSSFYLMRYSSYITPNVIFDESIIESEGGNEICPNGQNYCLDTTNGHAVYATDASGNQYNACTTGDVVSGSSCGSNTISCYFGAPTGSSPPACTSSNQSVIYKANMNFMPLSYLSNTGTNTLDICSDLLKNISLYPSVILCYVTDIGYAMTLNYQFFGSLPEESNLIVQYDCMYNLLNSPNGPFTGYRNNLINYSYNSGGVSFTNCAELSDTTNQSTIITCAQTYAKNYKPIYGEPMIQPCLWSINVASTTTINSPYTSTLKNTLNSCSFSLSTSTNYTQLPVKYAQFNNNGTSSLNLFEGGVSQQFVLENSKTVYPNPYTIPQNGVPAGIAVSTNIRAYNGQYLVPSLDNNGFNPGSFTVNLQPSPLKNGKWLILGFTNSSGINNIQADLTSQFVQPFCLGC